MVSVMACNFCIVYCLHNSIIASSYNYSIKRFIIFLRKLAEIYTAKSLPLAGHGDLSCYIIMDKYFLDLNVDYRQFL